MKCSEIDCPDEAVQGYALARSVRGNSKIVIGPIPFRPGQIIEVEDYYDIGKFEMRYKCLFHFSPKQYHQII